MVASAGMFADTGQIGPKESNSQMLEWPRTDGDASRRPSGVSFEKNADRERNVNYYRPIRDTEEASVSWRRDIGTYVAEAMGLPRGKVYWMKGWPEGYGFYDHQKGQLPNPRHDLYLCGSAVTVRFRSKNEFKPHAKWLMTDPTLNTLNCGCKYCTKTKSQVEINQNQGLGGQQRQAETHLRGTKPTPGEAMTHARRRVIREQLQQAKAQKPKATPKPEQTLTALPERLRDLNSGRTFRISELVWVNLANPIPVGGDGSIEIDFWPAVILNYSTKNEPTPHKPGETDYEIVAHLMFNIRLLGMDRQVMVPGDRLLPQLGYIPSQALLTAVKECQPNRPVTIELPEYTRFNPLPEFDGVLGLPSGSYTREDALPAFTLALHIVACLTPVWSATHSYSSSDKGVNDDELFQGLWWGSERIWLEDVVRLRPSREDLDPDNTMGLLPPSSPDAMDRSLLLRLTSILVDREDPKGMNICVGGDLYELAREDAAPLPPSTSQSSIFGSPTSLLLPSSPTRMDVSVEGSSNPAPDAAASPSSGESPVSMPPPPPGFTFHKLLTSGNEIVLDVGAIAGRYYPNILQAETLDRVMRTVNEERGVKAGEIVEGTIEGYAREKIRQSRSGPEAFETAKQALIQVAALMGVYVGEGNAMQPEQWVKGRLQTIKGAEKNGRSVLYQRWTNPDAGSDVEMLDG